MSISFRILSWQQNSTEYFSINRHCRDSSQVPLKGDVFGYPVLAEGMTPWSSRSKQKPREPRAMHASLALFSFTFVHKWIPTEDSQSKYRESGSHPCYRVPYCSLHLFSLFLPPFSISHFFSLAQPRRHHNNQKNTRVIKDILNTTPPSHPRLFSTYRCRAHPPSALDYICSTCTRSSLFCVYLSTSKLSVACEIPPLFCLFLSMA